MDKKQEYVKRAYRALHNAADMHYFGIKIEQSDLAIGVDLSSYSDSLIPLCRQELQQRRQQLENYIKIHEEFLTSLVPINLLPGAPDIAAKMAWAAVRAGVGPMAAVAGAIAQAVGEVLTPRCQEYIVENGGDIYIKTLRPRRVAVFAGNSPFSYRIAIRINPEESPLSICTSSGTVGPSLSLGYADAVVVKASEGALADAVATAAANRIQHESDLIKAIDYVKTISGVTGLLCIKNDKMATWGAIEIEPITGKTKNADR